MIIAAGLSAGGAIGGAALTRGGSRKAIDRQNEYNKPINQLQRLREAGLPHAAFVNGQAGNQSQAQIAESGVGEGIQNGINTFIQTSMQKKQIELLDAQIQATKAQAAKTEVEGNSLATDLQIKQGDPTVGEPISYGQRMAKFEHDMREIQLFSQRNNWEMQKLENEMRAELIKDGTLSEITRKSLESMIAALKLSAQAHNRGLIMDRLVEQMKKGGIGLAEALAMAMAMGDLHSPVSFPNINIQGSRTFTSEQYHDHKVDIWK